MTSSCEHDILEADALLIRSVEATVVDEMHRRNRLLALPQDHAVALLLKAYGEICRSPSSGAPSVYGHSNWNLLARGLSYALRWVLLDCPTGRHLPGRDNPVEEAAATRLIGTGAAYARLCSYFVPWSRGMMNAEVDAAERQIRFSLKWEIDPHFHVQQLQADLDWWLQEQGKWPAEEADVVFNKWKRSTAATSHGLFFDIGGVASRKSFDAFISWTNKVVMPEVPEDTSFGSYSLQDLRRFLAGLEMTCHCITELELQVDKRTDGTNDMGSWVLVVTEAEAGQFLASMTGVAAATCEAICHDLTFDSSRFHASTSATPFVRTRSGTILLSPWIIRNSVPQRKAVAALTNGTAERKYDYVSELIERHYLGEIAREIRGLGFRALVGQRFRFGGTETKPDILVLDNDNVLVSMIEFKNSLAATTVGEVADRMQEYERGIRQIRRAGELFKVNAAQMRARGIIIPAGGYRACLMFRLPIALPLPFHKDILVFDWHSMHGLGLLPQFLSTKPSGELPPWPDPPAVPHDYEMQVGKWLFKLTGMMLSPDGSQAE